VSTYGNVHATIDGDIQGQVAVGNHIYQFNVNGGVVNVAPPAEGKKFRRRKSPVDLRPRPFPSLLDRNDETAAVKSALKATVPVDLFGPGGIGKTSLLRSLAHNSELDVFPDGVVYRRVAGLGLEDVLQDLFDAFHESQPNFKPTNSEIRIGLQRIKALILLDDLSLNRDEVIALLDTVPGCAFILASLERDLWGEGRIIPLPGLPITEAVNLFVRELNRTLNDQEQAEIREICVKLGGHPLQILQSASLVRENAASFSDIRAKLQQDEPEEAVVSASLKSSTDKQKSLVAILAAAGGVGVPVEHLRALSQSDTVVKDLRDLASLGLVQEEGPGFRLVGELSGTISKLWDLTAWEDRLIEFLADWLLRKPVQKLLGDSVDVLVSSIQKAGEKNRWSEVVSIGRGLERTLILWRRWQTWLDILKLILKAARALGDRKVEAWALHQLGTRAACLGFSESARGFLTGALQIRQAIGDQAGLAVTQNNLNVFFNIPVPPQPGQARSGCRRYLNYGAIGAGGVVVVVAVVAVAWFLFSPIFAPVALSPTPVVVTVEATETPVPPTHTDIPTDTPTVTLTPTTTPTRTLTPRPVVIDFSVLADTIISGDCTYLQWDVDNASRVYLNGIEVAARDERLICPEKTTAYTVSAESPAGPAERQLVVRSLEPYPPPGFVADLGCNPWSFVQSSTFFSPKLGIGCARPLHYCLEPGSGCGKPAADAWCELYTPYDEAANFVAGEQKPLARYFSTRNNCTGSCATFESITCSIE
jgi:hypothetical protein